ncbi:nucleoside hydrolase [Anaerolactibacter massiliensis]|uniref:nucleoside hydrolase n=1 Tax=Anaerolactibacter massiliensis TaxID=2044573 RepID=UPI000CF98D3B|nr:nucleoside hydrolase [Anaerolactibacter massiliensis]
MSIPVWMDMDTGEDDAIAIMTAFQLPELQVVGMSAVAGNVELKHTFRNTRNVLSLIHREDVKVYPGAENPLRQKLTTAAYVHGETGLASAVLPESKAPSETEKAWDALYRTAKEYQGELNLILTGPETNAAIAFFKYPDLKQYLKRILIMGGAAVGGNSTPAAEFNIWADPEAAQAVFQSGVEVVMGGLDVTSRAGLSKEEVEELDHYPNAACRLFRSCTELARKLYSEHHNDTLLIHDACPVIYAAHPEYFTGTKAGVVIETRGTYTRGKTVTDLYTDSSYPLQQTIVVTDANRKAVADTIRTALEAY